MNLVKLISIDIIETIESGVSFGQKDLGRLSSTSPVSIIHSGIGKLSFDDADLKKNFAALTDAIVKAKPSGAKGKYVQKITLTSSMGPGLKVDLAEVEGA